MKILVCGDRNSSDWSLIKRTLDGLDISLLIEGGSKGVDRLAGFYADLNGIPHVTMPAQWRYYGRKAGPLRNQWMIDYLKPDLVVAFPGGRGTRNMVELANKVGIPVKEIKEENYDCFPKTTISFGIGGDDE